MTEEQWAVVDEVAGSFQADVIEGLLKAQEITKPGLELLKDWRMSLKAAKDVQNVLNLTWKQLLNTQKAIILMRLQQL